ncbi:hypothetical protein PFISCL1PPCAC_23233, partial [Pristionchus fissidentatus]
GARHAARRRGGAQGGRAPREGRRATGAGADSDGLVSQFVHWQGEDVPAAPGSARVKCGRQGNAGGLLVAPDRPHFQGGARAAGARAQLWRLALGLGRQRRQLAARAG